MALTGRRLALNEEGTLQYSSSVCGIRSRTGLQQPNDVLETLLTDIVNALALGTITTVHDSLDVIEGPSYDSE